MVRQYSKVIRRELPLQGTTNEMLWPVRSEQWPVAGDQGNPQGRPWQGCWAHLASHQQLDRRTWGLQAPAVAPCFYKGMILILHVLLLPQAGLLTDQHAEPCLLNCPLHGPHTLAAPVDGAA